VIPESALTNNMETLNAHSRAQFDGLQTNQINFYQQRVDTEQSTQGNS
jgi:hypothetical protein